MQLIGDQHFPSALKAGDRIGIAAPASPFDKQQFFRGIKILKEMGFEPVFTDGLFHTSGYLAGSDSDRLVLLHDLFADPSIQAIWCARGGYGSLRLLPQLDFESIRRTPKFFIGCSDITALLNTFYTNCGLVTLHAPMITTLSGADSLTLDAVAHAVFGIRHFNLTADPAVTIKSGKACGPVLGGNLATLCHMIGTPYAIDFSGSIIFLEDIGEKPYRIDRMLTQMKLAGCFDKAVGICFGSFFNCGDVQEILRILTGLCEDIGIPAFSGVNAGHGMPNLPLFIGADALLDADEGTLTYLTVQE